MLPEMLADFCTGGKTLPEIWFTLLHGGVNVARNSGRVLHGVQNLPRDSGQTLPRWGMINRSERREINLGDIFLYFPLLTCRVVCSPA